MHGQRLVAQPPARRDDRRIGLEADAHPGTVPAQLPDRVGHRALGPRRQAVVKRGRAVRPPPALDREVPEVVPAQAGGGIAHGQVGIQGLNRRLHAALPLCGV